MKTNNVNAASYGVGKERIQLCYFIPSIEFKFTYSISCECFVTGTINFLMKFVSELMIYTTF